MTESTTRAPTGPGDNGPGRVRPLLRYFLRLGFLGFGGPVALVGQMERELVSERHWLTAEQMREAIAGPAVGLGMEDWLQWVIATACFAITVLLHAEVAILFIGAGVVGIVYYGHLARRPFSSPAALAHRGSRPHRIPTGASDMGFGQVESYRLWIAAVSVTVAAAIAIPLAAGGSELPLRQARADIALPGRANRFDYASVDVQRRLLFLAHLGSGMVTAIDLRTARVAANVADVPAVHGVLAVPELGEVFATATGRNRLDVISERSFRVIASAPAGTYPDGMAYAPEARELFISDESGRTETVIDTRTNHRVATIPMGGEVGNSQYDPVSHEVLADVQTLDQIVAIDPGTNRLIARYPLPHSCRDDHSLLIDAPARLAFVACDGNAKLLLVDLTDMHVLPVHEVGRDPDVLAFDPGLRRLYVASESGVVTVFELQGRDLRLLGRKLLADEAHSVAVDPSTHLVYFPLQNIDGRGVLRVMAPTDVVPSTK